MALINIISTLEDRTFIEKKKRMGFQIIFRQCIDIVFSRKWGDTYIHKHIYVWINCIVRPNYLPFSKTISSLCMRCPPTRGCLEFPTLEICYGQWDWWQLWHKHRLEICLCDWVCLLFPLCHLHEKNIPGQPTDPKRTMSYLEQLIPKRLEVLV